MTRDAFISGLVTHFGIPEPVAIEHAEIQERLGCAPWLKPRIATLNKPFILESGRTYYVTTDERGQMVACAEVKSQ